MGYNCATNPEHFKPFLSCLRSLSCLLGANVKNIQGIEGFPGWPSNWKPRNSWILDPAPSRENSDHKLDHQKCHDRNGAKSGDPKSRIPKYGKNMIWIIHLWKVCVGLWMDSVFVQAFVRAFFDPQWASVFVQTFVGALFFPSVFVQVGSHPGWLVGFPQGYSDLLLLYHKGTTGVQSLFHKPTKYVCVISFPSSHVCFSHILKWSSVGAKILMKSLPKLPCLKLLQLWTSPLNET